jgi:hypothetical protein
MSTLNGLLNMECFIKEDFMNRKLTTIAISTALALGSHAAFATGTTVALDTANTTQMSSLLVFPRIDVSEGKNTVVRITNDSTKGVFVKCYYQNHILFDASGVKNKVDFEFFITRNQPVYFDALTGRGNQIVNIFPTEGERVGSLTCWAVNADGNKQLSFNHLAGNAVIEDVQSGDTEIYNAWGFQAAGADKAPVGTGGLIEMNGTHYNTCPKYLIGNFRPFNPDPVDTQLTVSSCTQDVRQDNAIHTTKLKFDVWNGNETKFTGAWECMDSWHEVWLRDGEGGIDRAGQNFHSNVLGTEIASYRVNGIASSQCNAATAPWYTQSEAVGLVGVQLTNINYGDNYELEELHGSGALSGSIAWDAE